MAAANLNVGQLKDAAGWSKRAEAMKEPVQHRTSCIMMCFGEVLPKTTW